jgi:transposase-like protein
MIEVTEMYCSGISPATMSTITDKLIDEVKAWQARPLENLYPFVWLDAIHYKIRDKGRYQNKAIYTVLALNMEGKKEVLGLYLSESKPWGQIFLPPTTPVRCKNSKLAISEFANTHITWNRR